MRKRSRRTSPRPEARRPVTEPDGGTCDVMAGPGLTCFRSRPDMLVAASGSAIADMQARRAEPKLRKPVVNLRELGCGGIARLLLKPAG